MSRLALLNTGLLLGLVAGLGDGLLLVRENPRSFSGIVDCLRFVSASTVLHVGLGAVGGIALSVLHAVGPSLRAGAIVGAGLALWVFLWVGIRVHVRFLFGEPLLSAASLFADAVVLVVSVAAVAGFWKLGGARLERALPRPALTVVSGVAMAVCLAIVGLDRTAGNEAGPSGEPPAGARDVLLLTLDTTRADHLSCFGYPRGTTPAIDRLARTSVTSTAIYAAIPLTNPSHCSIFTGRLPREHGVVNNGMALPDTISTFVPALGASGWNCAAFVSGIPLKAGLSGLAPGFHVYDDRFSALEHVHPMMTTLAVVRAANRLLPTDFIERRAADTCDAAIGWLRESRGPRFLWVHLFDPHTPYDASRPWAQRFAAESPHWSSQGRPATGWPIADYDAEIAEADRQVGRLLRTWEEVTDGAGIVVLTADHGEGLEQHDELTHGSLLFEEDLRIPLVIRDRRIADAPLVSRRPSPATALTHTIPRLAGLPPGDAVPEPVLLLETFAPEGRENKSAIIEYVSEFGQPAKLIVNWTTGEELGYLLGDDPGETQPVDTTGPGWAELRASLPGAIALEGGELDPEVERRLRALGYIH